MIMCSEEEKHDVTGVKSCEKRPPQNPMLPMHFTWPEKFYKNKSKYILGQFLILKKHEHIGAAQASLCAQFDSISDRILCFPLQLLLEAPDDILCFKFSASDPNILAGGCRNGQVVLWDITAHVDRLKQPRGGNRNKRSNVLVRWGVTIIENLQLSSV